MTQPFKNFSLTLSVGFFVCLHLITALVIIYEKVDEDVFSY